MAERRICSAAVGKLLLTEGISAFRKISARDPRRFAAKKHKRCKIRYCHKPVKGI